MAAPKMDVIMIKFSKKILHYLKPLYQLRAEYVKSELEAYLQAFHIDPDSTGRLNWYKGMRLYTVYADSILYDESASPFRNLTAHLPLIKKLQCNAMYILPFFESPLLDKGFDISNHYNVRKDLGTMRDMIDFRNAADQAKIYRFMDLVLNHVSDQHGWFKKAQAGNEYYRNYFICAKEPPKFVRKLNKENVVMAEYDVAGKKVSLDIAFPEFAGKIPHWRKGDDGYWYYHTYYPHQLDLNWLNPDVFIEFGKMIMYWASLGFNFRLDAIPYVGKQPYKMIDESRGSYTQYIIAALKCVSEKVCARSTILVETFEKLPTVMQYFGTKQNERAHLAYNFHLSTNSWVSLVKQDTSFIWQTLNKQKKIPLHAEWLNFLRNHDELSLAHLSEKNTQEMQKELLKFGADFREGHGVSGRTFSLLGGNYERYRMAYFLLASFPGSLMIMYGDDIAFKNIPLADLSKAQRVDSRNINRGTLKATDYQSPAALELVGYFAKLFKTRSKLQSYFKKWPKRLGNQSNIYAACYQDEEKKLFAYINLSSQPQKIKKDVSELKAAFIVNKVEHTAKAITLGAYGGIWLVAKKSAISPRA
jgi:glycosidase